MFYVYEWFIIETGEVFYIGKGSKNRYKSKKKNNKLFEQTLRNYNCDVRIVSYYENEDDAFEAERRRILHYKNIGQASCNKSGFGGGRAQVWDEERRKEKSINNPMKSELQRRLVSERLSKKVKIDGIIFNRVKDAMAYFHISSYTLKEWKESGRCEYLEKENKAPPKLKVETDISKASKIENNHLLVYQGKEYNSMNMLANDIGKDVTTIMTWVRNGFDTKGNPCRYKDDCNMYIFRPKEPFHLGRCKAFIVEGIRYESLEDASKATGLSTWKLRAYAKGEVKNPPVKCEYDNQQPSRKKFKYNCIAEGSETNR